VSGPLSHIRVLDLSRIMAGPWASQILADLGADVVKVERPRVGDDTRAWGPPYLRDSSGKAGTEAGYYLCVNRGKRSVTIDLNTPEGQNLVKALAVRSDILIENFKVGTLSKFGLGHSQLKDANPRLIYASITGFGQTGPKAKAAAYDFMIQAMGGLMSVTGQRDDLPGGGPQKVGVPIVDLMSGGRCARPVWRCQLGNCPCLGRAVRSPRRSPRIRERGNGSPSGQPCPSVTLARGEPRENLVGDNRC